MRKMSEVNKIGSIYDWPSLGPNVELLRDIVPANLGKGGLPVAQVTMDNNDLATVKQDHPLVPDMMCLYYSCTGFMMAAHGEPYV